MQSNLTNMAPVSHSNSLSGHTTSNAPTPSHLAKYDTLNEQHDDIRPNYSASQVLKSSTLLSTILQQFDKRVNLRGTYKGKEKNCYPDIEPLKLKLTQVTKLSSQGTISQ